MEIFHRVKENNKHSFYDIVVFSFSFRRTFTFWKSVEKHIVSRWSSGFTQFVSVRKRTETKAMKSFVNFSLYHRFHLDEGFQGCIHEFSINERRITFNSSEHQTILSAQNIGENTTLKFRHDENFLLSFLRFLDECFANPCRTGVASCRNGTRCIPIRNNDANSYKCLCNDYLSFTSSTSNSDCSVQLIDHCSLRPCESDQQCVHVYPNNYTCICLNCSSSKTSKWWRKNDEFRFNSFLSFRWTFRRCILFE